MVKLSHSGGPQTTVGFTGLIKPTGVAVGTDGSIYVADGYGQNYVLKFDAERKFVKAFGGPGTAEGKFQTCHGIGLDKRQGKPLLLMGRNAAAAANAIAGELRVHHLDRDRRLPGPGRVHRRERVGHRHRRRRARRRARRQACRGRTPGTRALRCRGGWPGPAPYGYLNNKADKTVIVEVVRFKREGIYKKYVRVRKRYKAHDESARTLATWCESQPEFVQVLHPALPHSPGHAHWQALCINGFGGAAALFSVRICSTARSMRLRGARPNLIAVPITPVPSAFVRINRSPTLAPAFVRMRLGSTEPVTA